MPATPPPTPQGALIGSLANVLIGTLAPLVREKIGRELGRHTSPEVADQMATTIIGAAQAATGRTDPVEATAAAKASPAAITQIERAATLKLDELAPLLDKLTEIERGGWTAEEESRAAAAARVNTQDVFLTRAIVFLVVGTLVVCAVLIGILAWLKMDSALTAVLALFTMGTGIIFGKFGTRYDFGYGSSRGSDTKQVLIDSVVRKQ